eukprot:TRINITY_DN3073_c0_g1_i2.p1 TRINITY_DN3073_c0_g1~~TRINITY_DN3073_c0_g1_i2.p1  ORF type:complete len:310 (+),score=73.18 TRINITY_DN3073_c0_g1_i2:51-932(+)
MTSKLDHIQDTNFPRDPEGRVYHLGVKRGEVANRVLSVGDAGRAKMLSTLFDNPDNLLIVSNRGFTVYTGLYKKVPLTIIATGMGTPMIDFLVRECRAVVDGSLAILRYGTCGTPQGSIPVGSVIIADYSVLIRRNPDHWYTSSNPDEKLADVASYEISKPVPADRVFADLIFTKMTDRLGNCVVRGVNATADSFYSSQGRIDSAFDDDNDNLIDTLLVKYPDIASLEMESFQLMHLAHCSRGHSVKAAAATIVLAQRKSNVFLDNESKHRLEKAGGEVCLQSLIQYEIDPQV